jgi:hypothetical protein
LLAFQGNVCAVCKKPPGKTRLHVDHDHGNGQLRGILCSFCNVRLIGRHKDYRLFLAAAEYLRVYPWVSCFGDNRIVPKKKRKRAAGKIRKEETDRRN